MHDDAAIHGEVAPAFSRVRDAFAASFEGKPTMGAALAIRHRGEPVVDLWGGVADARTGQPWQRDTLSVIFSCTKGLVSILAAQLVRDGRLDYLAPVAESWPEFAAAGKESVLVRDLLSHRSGVSAPRHPLSTQQLTNWDAIVEALAAQPPLWSPGSGYAYHALTHGWLVGEVLRRVTGRSVRQLFAESIAEPLHAEAWIGLPAAEQSRVAHLTVGDTLAEVTAQRAAARPLDEIDWSEQALTLGGALPIELVGEDAGFNRADVRAAEIPGAGGIATARSLAAIWSATVVETDGVRLLDRATVDAATAVQSEGAPVWQNVPPPWPRWGMGFQIDSERRRYVTPAGFGHDGAGGQCAFAEPDLGIGFAFVTNQLEATDDPRANAIIDALRESLA